jgi:hypothetical protein
LRHKRADYAEQYAQATAALAAAALKEAEFAALDALARAELDAQRWSG